MSLAEFLHARALTSTRSRIALDIVGGGATAGGAWWAKPAGWTVFASAGACLAMYGVWAAAERRLQAEFRLAAAEFTWVAIRTTAGALGAVAFLTFLFALLGVTLGTWIS